MSEEQQPQIKIDLGASAKAEIKAEVPSSSMGRLVDAITDALRPFTEARGLRGDQIRLQREDVLIEIARRARKRVELENLEPNPLETRLLIPLAERASLTDPSDEALIEAWANLMAAASKGRAANNIIYVDILSKLDSVHLAYLEHIARPSSAGFLEGFLHVASEIDEFFDRQIESCLEQNNATELDEETLQPFFDSCDAFFERKGTCLLAGALEYGHSSSRLSYYEIYGAVDFQRFPNSITGALESLSLIERKRYENHKQLTVALWVEYHALTMFGQEFFYACHEARNIHG